MAASAAGFVAEVEKSSFVVEGGAELDSALVAETTRRRTYLEEAADYFEGVAVVDLDSVDNAAVAAAPKKQRGGHY